MDMQGETRIPAPRQIVWDALNDPEVLKQCITGCQSLERTEEGGFEATVQAKVGPVKATFKGAVRLENVNAPESYTIAGEGKGGAAGFAKGGADVSLREEGDETVLTYTVAATVGGKLAQIGARLVDSTAKKYATEFFEKFAELAHARAEGPVATEDQPTQAAPEPAVSEAEAPSPAASSDEETEVIKAAIQATDATAEKRRSMSPMKWILILIAILAALTLIFGGDGAMTGGSN